MATTYTADKVASTVQARAGTDLTCVYSTYEATTKLIINDVIQMCKVPAGATVVEVVLSCDDLDTSATPAAVLAVGDGDDVDRYIKDSTIGQTGGTVRLGSGIVIADCLGYEYTAADTIDVKITTAPAAGGTGTITLAVFYTMQQ